VTQEGGRAVFENRVSGDVAAWGGRWDHFDSYRRLRLLSRLAESRKMSELALGHPDKVYLIDIILFNSHDCHSRLSAHIVEDRTLAGKQYEPVNGFQLFLVEALLDSIPQQHGKYHPFLL
jgi:hypothetical protein